jgi:hypothetical protein
MTAALFETQKFVSVFKDVSNDGSENIVVLLGQESGIYASQNPHQQTHELHNECFHLASRPVTPLHAVPVSFSCKYLLEAFAQAS